MSPNTCAICGGADRFAVGVCASCASHGSDARLIMVRPALDRGAQSELEFAVQEWLGPAGGSQVAAESVRGRRTLAIVPAAIAPAVERAFGAAGIATRVLPVQQWARALPASFVTMLVAVSFAGAMAGWRSDAFMLWTTPAMVSLLLAGGWLQIRKPLLRFERTRPALPAATRSLLAGALAQLTPGRPRELVLDLAGAAERTYASLPAAFRRAPLGHSVIELVAEAGPLGVETMRLQNIADQLGDPADPRQRHALEQLRDGVEARLRLLGEARTLLARIASERADVQEGAAADVKRLVDQLRSEQQWRLEGERAVTAITDAR